MNLEHSDNSTDELFEHYRFEVDPKQSSLRIDKFLVDRLPNVTRSKIQSGIKHQLVRVNENYVKSNYKVHPGDVISISFPTPPRDDEVNPENINLNIIFEDDHLLVINKPAGMVVHPAYNNWTGTLVNGLVYHFNNLPEMKNNFGRPGLVHRIDKDTSGLLVIAKNEEAMNGLASQFFHHTIERTYYALVWGEPEEKGTIEVNVGRSLKDRRITRAFPKGDYGKEAITHYKVLKYLRYVSLVKCNLETGRTHQIRAHMKYIGHTLFNDSLYGGNQILKGTKFSKYKSFVENCFKIIPRQALHAKSLGFKHPGSGKFVEFDSELPDDFTKVLEKWDHYVQYN